MLSGYTAVGHGGMLPPQPGFIESLLRARKSKDFGGPGYGLGVPVQTPGGIQFV